MSRHLSTTTELDRAEAEWWAHNGDLEALYCWVQTPRARRILRGHYVRRMNQSLPEDAKVLELGCGTGWVGLELMRKSRRTLVGADASSDQIERARTAAELAGLTSRTRFEVIDGSGLRTAETFDAVVMHAFLHHLATAEIEAALGDAVARLRPGGQLVLLEPVVRRPSPDQPMVGARLLGLEDRVRMLPTRLAQRGLRTISCDEQAVRDRLETRALPPSPFGPSPKETRFEEDELLHLLRAAGLTVRYSEPVLCMAHLVAQEVLVASLSQPKLWSVATAPMLLLATSLDRLALTRGEAHPHIWTFELILAGAS